jgi:hypothetical protein
MKKDIAKKWVKALRSGKYKQGKSYLKQFNSKGQPRHCCLGVLCELYNDTMKKNHKKLLFTEEMEGDISGTSFVSFDLADEFLPEVVKKWAGIKDKTGYFICKTKYKNYEYEDTQDLAVMNDTGKKFSTIADIIEKNVENL